ncbi:MAG: DUF2264 domain-containing protein [Thermomicrobiales bacterium]
MAHESLFSRSEAESMFARVVAGWANCLDETGARIYLDGVTAPYDAGGSYEGVTRMFWGIGGWLSWPNRPSTVNWRGVDYDLVEIMRRAVLNGTDPQSRGYWGIPDTDALDLVESGHVAFSLWQTRYRLWTMLDHTQQDQITRWLAAVSPAPDSFKNNFAMFWLLNHGSRQALDQPFDDDLITSILEYFDGVYCGNGWYDDGPATGTNHFDDYNYWVFASHFLCWAQTAPESRSSDVAIHLARIRQMMQHVPYFYGADGSYALYGRSLSYKFARLGAPLWAYRAGIWPHEPGLLRRLTGQHLRWHVDRGAIRADGTLTQALTSEGSVEIRETYGSTGAPYWAMQAFGGLWSIPDDDPFWSDDEVPLPVEQGDFLKTFAEPGWMVVGTGSSGHVQRFSTHSAKYPSKYSKFVTSTLAPFNCGLIDGRPSPDSMLCLVDDGEPGHRDITLASSMSDAGWLRLRYEQHVGGLTHRIETAIVIAGEHHLRLHKVTLDPGAVHVYAVEGSAPLGFPPGGFIDSGRTSDRMSGWASYGGRLVGIRALQGYSRAAFPAAWGGNDGINSVYGKHVLPCLDVDIIESGSVLACIVFAGLGSGPESMDTGIPTISWSDSGLITVSWRAGEDLIVPALD